MLLNPVESGFKIGDLITFGCAIFFACHIISQDKYVKQDPQYMRPAEVDVLCGDYSKARELFGWKPKTKFHQLVGRMIEKDVSLLEDK